MWVPVLLAIGGLFGLALEIAAANSNSRAQAKLGKQALWSATVAGVLLGVVSFLGGMVSLYPEYSLGKDLRVSGVPFLTVILTVEGGHLKDFISPLILPALIGNAAFAGLLPQVLIFMIREIHQRADTR
jgi:hypothetical protein